MAKKGYSRAAVFANRVTGMWGLRCGRPSGGDPGSGRHRPRRTQTGTWDEAEAKLRVMVQAARAVKRELELE